MKLVETIISKGKIVESDSSKLPKGVLCRGVWPICNIGELNHNQRVYEKAVWEKVNADTGIVEKMKNRTLFGQAEHPKETQSDLQLTSHIITDKFFENVTENGKTIEKAFDKIDILDTPCGRIINTLLEAGCMVGVSTRAEGDLEEAEKDGKKFQRVIPESFRYVTTDFTADPSTLGTLPMNLEKNLVREIKEAATHRGMTRNFATSLLGGLKDDEAKQLKETIEGSKICKCHSEFLCSHCDECAKKKAEDKEEVNEASNLNVYGVVWQEKYNKYGQATKRDRKEFLYGSARDAFIEQVKQRPEFIKIVKVIDPVKENIETIEQLINRECINAGMGVVIREGKGAYKGTIKSINESSVVVSVKDGEKTKDVKVDNGASCAQIEANGKVTIWMDGNKPAESNPTYEDVDAIHDEMKDELDGVNDEQINAQDDNGNASNMEESILCKKCNTMMLKSELKEGKCPHCVKKPLKEDREETAEDAVDEVVSWCWSGSDEDRAPETEKEIKKLIKKYGNQTISDIFVDIIIPNSGWTLDDLRFLGKIFGDSFKKKMAKRIFESKQLKEYFDPKEVAVYLDAYTASDLTEYNDIPKEDADKIFASYKDDYETAKKILANVEMYAKRKKLKDTKDLPGNFPTFWMETDDAFTMAAEGDSSAIKGMVNSIVEWGYENDFVDDVNESKTISFTAKSLKQLKIKEAAVRAERDKAVELLENHNSKLAMLTANLNEAKAEVESLCKILESKTTNIKKIDESKKVAESNLTLLNNKIIVMEKEIAQAKQSTEKKLNEQKVQLEKDKQKSIVESYVGFKVRNSGITLTQNSKALLESCVSTVEVDKVFEQIRDALRRDALRPESATDIKVIVEKKEDPGFKSIKESVSNAFSGM